MSCLTPSLLPPQAAKPPIEADKANQEAAEAAKSPLPDSDLSDEERGSPSKENKPAGGQGSSAWETPAFLGVQPGMWTHPHGLQAFQVTGGATTGCYAGHL